MRAEFQTKNVDKSFSQNIVAIKTVKNSIKLANISEFAEDIMLSEYQKTPNV